MKVTFMKYTGSEWGDETCGCTFGREFLTARITEVRPEAYLLAVVIFYNECNLMIFPS